MMAYPDYPGVRAGSPDTSLAAAVSVADAAKSREAKALQLIRARAERGCTADEVAEALGWERYSSRPRISTMKARGEIVDSGRRRKAASGRSQAVMVVPEYGPPVPPDPQGDLLGDAA